MPAAAQAQPKLQIPPRPHIRPKPTARPMRTLAVDVGGTGIKAMILSPYGKPITKRTRFKTPRPATPNAVIKMIVALANTQGKYNRVSVGFPGVVKRGVIATAPNLDGNWRGCKLAHILCEKLGKPVRVANDADVQGLGVVSGHGVELVITLGTGFGSGLFVDGRLVPNLEIPHHPFLKNKTYEQMPGDAARRKVGNKKWNKRLLKAIASLESTFNYDTLYLGGGNAERVRVKLPRNVKVVSNLAGLTGGIALWRD